MSNRVGELLHLPDVNVLKAGAVAFGAAFFLHTGRLNEAPFDPVASQVTPKVRELGVAGISASVTYEPAPATPETAPPKPGKAQETELEQGVPAIVQRYIDNNAILIGALRCSGALVRDKEGDPIGALTAAHCLKGEAHQINTYVKGSDGKEYVVSKSIPIELQSGADTVDLKTIGGVKEFVVPPNDSGIDQAFAVLPGHTPREVIAAYRRRQLTEKQIEGLGLRPPRIWLAGYPYTQNGDDAGNMIRQEFPTTYIGRDITPYEDGTWVDTLEATAVEDSNGATCTWGLSGGEGFVIRNVALSGGGRKQVIRAVGNFSFFALFAPLHEKGGSEQIFTQQDAKAARAYYHQNYPEVDWRGIDAVCGYVDQQIGKKFGIIHVVPNLEAVPGR